MNSCELSRVFDRISCICSKVGPLYNSTYFFSSIHTLQSSECLVSIYWLLGSCEYSFNLLHCTRTIEIKSVTVVNEYRNCSRVAFVFFVRCDLLRELDLIWRVFKILGVDVDPQKSNGVLAKVWCFVSVLWSNDILWK